MRTSDGRFGGFCVVYRIGGTENFLWKRSTVFETRREAQLCKQALHRAGYKGHVEDYKKSKAIGLPETFE